MSDDLVERSRKVATELEQWVQKYTGIDRKSIEAELIREQADRIEELEAKLAKAVECVAWCAIYEESEVARATIAELTGGKDE